VTREETAVACFKIGLLYWLGETEEVSDVDLVWATLLHHVTMTRSVASTSL
jgi:hypothetical protein